MTDVAVNDGFWHFICVTWQAKNGSWNIYQDGKLSANGTNLATGESVDGRGSLVNILCYEVPLTANLTN